MRKTWQKPKLCVLVRGSPGENVLSYCKSIGLPNVGPVVEETDCIQNFVHCDVCQTALIS